MENADYNRKYGVSPVFRTYNAATVASGASFNYDFEVSAPKAQKYFPLNFLKITNSSTTNPLLLYINGDKSPIDYIPAGTFLSYDKDTIIAFRSLQLENAGTGTIAINEIQIFAQRVAVETKDMARDIHAAILQKKNPNVV